MSVKLTFQSSGMMPSDSAPLVLRGPSLTIGRGATNDVALPDPEQVLSRNHCVIEDHGGNIVVVDLSSNGTFLNYSKMPLGPTPTPLNHGDVLTVGSYELAVEISGRAGGVDPLGLDPLTPDPLSPGNAQNAPDPLALLEDGAGPSVGPGTGQSTGQSGDFLDDLLGGAAPNGPGSLRPQDPLDELLGEAIGEADAPFFDTAADTAADSSQPAVADHTPAGQEGFTPQRPAGAGAVIPEDWDDAFFAGIGSEADPAETPADDPFAENPFAEAGDAIAPGPQAQAAQAQDAQANPGATAATEDPRKDTPPAAAPTSPGPATGARLGSAPVPPPAPAGPEAGDRGTETGFAKFATGLGLEDLRVRPEDQPATLARMGRVMRLLITGLREILMTRSSIKSEFRIEQTMISAGGNNPLKFSISPEQAVDSMVQPSARGYLDAEAAAEEALRDIKAHEVAMVTGMEAALKGVLKQLDPQALEAQIQERGGVSGLLRNKKAQYWDIYGQHYAEIADQAENEFHDLFSREFARAYQAQLERLKDTK